jgi:hypothetical protein
VLDVAWVPVATVNKEKKCAIAQNSTFKDEFK